MNEALELTDKGNKDMQVGVKETVPMVKLKKDKVKKKKVETEIRHEVVGDEVKFLCDHCNYKGSSKTAVRMHIAKKHRGEKRGRGDEEGEENESTKKAKPDDENPDDTVESIEDFKDSSFNIENGNYLVKVFLIFVQY